MVNSSVGSLVFGKIDTWLVSFPFMQSPETVPQELQLELIDLQCDTVLKDKFIQNMAQRILVLLGSMYVCDEHQQNTPQISDE